MKQPALWISEIEYLVIDRFNGGAHWRLSVKGNQVDFWPTTGRIALPSGNINVYSVESFWSAIDEAFPAERPGLDPGKGSGPVWVHQIKLITGFPLEEEINQFLTHVVMEWGGKFVGVQYLPSVMSNEGYCAIVIYQIPQEKSTE